MLNSLIVYVEDDERDVEFFSRALEQVRHRGDFKHLRTVAAAKDYLGDLATPPAIILIDLHIGAEGGKDLIVFIRSLSAFYKVPIVALSGSYVFEDSDKAYEMGANLFMVKPPDIKGWTDMVFKLRDYFPPG